ncbi:XRE family transcriptional regulator [Clostridium sp. AF19-22AC]|jgi:transcriptional regulator with XRE-family HTH domain|uniref:helix-turn-helix domain-containing protein n=1 Tax=Clostridia TaxID=186801 RepID=UPI000E4B7FB3|nr:MULTISPECIES: helix-turn-helix transcriptional regulator [Clostridia]RHR24751.1 XRE family transcriptional regulator [Clostridium sp. AF19-22AC]DAQ34314.1 MAG TPA: Helix-turn-helix XRE-family like protein [Caudoviricetes sp.]
MAEIGKKIREKREKLGMTQEELALKLGYKSKTTIAKIENGTNDIAQSKVIEFAHALDTTSGYLMGWEDEDAAIKSRKMEHSSDGLFSLLAAYYDKIIEHQDDPDGCTEPSYELIKDKQSFIVEERLLFEVSNILINILPSLITSVTNNSDIDAMNYFRYDIINQGVTLDDANALTKKYVSLTERSRKSIEAYKNFEKDVALLLETENISDIDSQ